MTASISQRLGSAASVAKALRLHVEEKMSAAQIARRMGVSKSTAARWLKRGGGK